MACAGRNSSDLWDSSWDSVWLGSVPISLGSSDGISGCRIPSRGSLPTSDGSL